MNVLTSFGPYFVLVIAAVAGVGGLLFWSLRRRGKPGQAGEELGESFDFSQTHAAYMAQMQQALCEKDYAFLATRGRGELARRVKRERTRVLLSYLEAIRADFERLIRAARWIATLSPEVAPAQEWERLRLTVQFALNYRLIRARLRLGLMAAPQLNVLSEGVCELTMRIERAMTELGERSALASGIASGLHS